MNKNSPNTYSDLPGAVGIQRLPPSHPVVDDSVVEGSFTFYLRGWSTPGADLIAEEGTDTLLGNHNSRSFSLEALCMAGRECDKGRPSP